MQDVEPDKRVGRGRRWGGFATRKQSFLLITDQTKILTIHRHLNTPKYVPK